MGPLGELGALFNPGMRHEIEERESKANRREEEGNARDGDLRIDLASGVAVINIPGRAAREDQGGSDDARPGSTDTRVDGPKVSGRVTQKQTAASRPEVKSAAKSTARSGRQGASPAAARRAGSADRTSAGRPSGPRGERGDSSTAPEKPTDVQRPASKASRAAR